MGDESPNRARNREFCAVFADASLATSGHMHQDSHPRFKNAASRHAFLHPPTHGEDQIVHSPVAPTRPLTDPLSEREIDVLHLVADGLSNREISELLFVALGTMKGHDRRIFARIGVQRRTEAQSRARELELLLNLM